MDDAGISQRSCICRLCKGIGHPVSRYIRTRHIETYGIYDRLDESESDGDDIHESDWDNHWVDDQELESACAARQKSSMDMGHDSVSSPQHAHGESGTDEE